MLVIAHPLLYAFGAYGSMLLMMNAGLPLFAAIGVAAGGAAVLSLAFSLSAIRVSGDYLLIASIGFLLGSLQVIKNTEWLGGASDLSGPAVFAADSDSDRPPFR